MTTELNFEELYQEIDIADLMERILERLVKASESGMHEMLLVVQQEEYKALLYYAGCADKNRTKVRVPLLGSLHIDEIQPFLSRMKHSPTTGLTTMGMPTIGSDNVGELSPWIL